jgi:hypothetical protein
MITTDSEGASILVAWSRKAIYVRREYEVTGAPDLQDDSTPRRMVIRPRKVIVRQVYGSSLVRGATIEGRQVRRDGELSGNKMICAGFTDWYDSTPPSWLNDLMASEGLEWQDPASRRG